MIGKASALVLLPLLVCCQAARSGGDPAEPVTIEDLQPLPAELTTANARLIVRRVLQAHRRSNDHPDEGYGYVFRDSGFVQIHRLTPLDRAEGRVSRTFVDYASVRSAQAEPYFDFRRLRERYRVLLGGPFRRWEAHALPSIPEPELGREPFSREVPSLSLALDDPVMAQQLCDALLLLTTR